MMIHEKIDKALGAHLTAGNREPRNLYLGRLEHAELVGKCFGEPFHPADIRDIDVCEETRMEWMGLKLFKVDAKSHVGFS